MRLAAADNNGHFMLKARAGQRADPSEATFVTAEVLDASEAGTRLTARRRAVFRELTRDPNRALVEVTAWSEDLTRAVRAYSAAYREALVTAGSADVLRELLLFDTLQLSVEHPDDELPSVVVLPTHPLRLLWYAAYADLLRTWEAPLSRLGREEVRKMLDVELIGRIEPRNLPALALDVNDAPVLFAHNLTFFRPSTVNARGPRSRPSHGERRHPFGSLGTRTYSATSPHGDSATSCRPIATSIPTWRPLGSRP